MEKVGGDQHQQTGKGEFARVVSSCPSCAVAAEGQGGQLRRREMLELDPAKSSCKRESES